MLPVIPMEINMEYKKNDYVTVNIEDIGSDGEGIGKIDGFTLFIKDAMIGDTVEAKIMKSKKNYAYARLEKVITPSPFRVQPKCEYHRQCGGCQIQALSYEKQLEFKQGKVQNNLIRIGGFAQEHINACMEPIVGMDEPFYYRNKAQYPVGTDKEGRIITGFYAGHTHSIIANTECHLGVPINKEILELILKYMEENHVTAYEESTGKGCVRHVLIRSGFTSGELMVCIIINGKDQKRCKRGEFLPNQKILLDRLAAVPGMTSISVSINTENTNVIMGKEIHTLWGETTISDVIHVRDMKKEGYPRTGQELSFKISPLSFYQVNPVQTEKLYSLALDYAGLTGQETVWDLYCGIGTISLFLAGRAKQVYGVEIVPQAIEDAKENAKRNHIKNAEFFVGKAEEVLPEFYGRMSNKQSQDASYNEGTKSSREPQTTTYDMLHPDVIVVDPPRKGCDEACLETMLKMQPQKIVYVSCDSATMARDVKLLCEGGYELKKVRAVDQFAHTVHVETVVLLSQQKPDDVIEVEIELEELDLTSAESKATYKEIQEYVLKEHGLKVSNLYISQVKNAIKKDCVRKCGIEVGENYNLPKSEGARGPVDLCSARTGAGAETARQPQCPEEKEKAIKDALEHFGMV